LIMVLRIARFGRTIRLARVLESLGLERAQKEEHDDTMMFGEMNMNQYYITITLFLLVAIKVLQLSLNTRRPPLPPGGGGEWVLTSNDPVHRKQNGQVRTDEASGVLGMSVQGDGVRNIRRVFLKVGDPGREGRGF
jgi:hypothetical protein